MAARDPGPTAAPALRIGCSGWQYAAWRGTFYPKSLPTGAWLAHYTGVFDTVEINNTFYRLPSARAFTAWRRATPAGFLIAVKASRYLTHMKQLHDPGAPLRRLFSRACALGARLGPVLYQLPERMHLDLPRLDRFLARLATTPASACAPGARAAYAQVARPLRHVIEFRHPSWYVRDVFDRLRARDIAICLHDRAGSPLAREVTASFVYVRYHGTSGHYRGGYGRRALGEWADWLASVWHDGRGVYAYFNNDPGAMAPRNAVTLRAMVRERLGPSAPKYFTPVEAGLTGQRPR